MVTQGLLRVEHALLSRRGASPWPVQCSGCHRCDQYGASRRDRQVPRVAPTPARRGHASRSRRCVDSSGPRHRGGRLLGSYPVLACGCAFTGRGGRTGPDAPRWNRRIAVCEAGTTPEEMWRAHQRQHVSCRLVYCWAHPCASASPIPEQPKRSLKVVGHRLLATFRAIRLVRRPRAPSPRAQRLDRLRPRAGPRWFELHDETDRGSR